MDNISKIKESLNNSNFKVDDITLKFNNKLHIGRNELNNIKWFQFKFDKELKGLYSAINLMFFKVDENTLNNSKKCVVIGGKGVSTMMVPHIDERTGNIHPGKGYVDSFGHNKIYQLVLVNTSKVDPGPKTMNIEVTSDVYSYSTDCLVHKSCYFPRIDNSIPENDFRYEFLKQVCKKIYEYDKDILSDEIIKEISK